MTNTLSTGIRRHGAGWRATVSCGRNRPPIQKHFQLETDMRVMQHWREDTKASLRLTRKQRATAGTFEHDAKKYLRAIKALPTHEDRTRDIYRWIAIFGTQQRDTITSADIRYWRDRWMTEPRKDHPSPTIGDRRRKRKRPDPKADQPFAASTINHWLRALSNLWTVLDGRRAPNPVADVPEVQEPDALPRALDYATIEDIINAIPDRGRPRAGKPLETFSATKLRLRVLAYTGLTYAQLKALKPSDVDLVNGTMLVKRRLKGKGVQPKLLPLLPQAIEAFTALKDAKAFGPFSGGSVRKVFLRAVARVNQARADARAPLVNIRPNDLRHSMGALVYAATQDLRAVADLLQHGSTRTTQRYALAAANQVLIAQLAKVRTSQNVEPSAKS